MTLPTILLALLIALLIGALYHLVRGGRGWHLLMYFGLSILGFTAGHFLGVWLGWYLFAVGSLNIGMGGIVSIVFMMAGDWLSRPEGKREGRV